MAFNMDSLKRSLGLSGAEERLKTLDLEGIATLIKSGNVKNIITAVGAGISTCK